MGLGGGNWQPAQQVSFASLTSPSPPKGAYSGWSSPTSEHEGRPANPGCLPEHQPLVMRSNPEPETFSVG